LLLLTLPLFIAWLGFFKVVFISRHVRVFNHVPDHQHSSTSPTIQHHCYPSPTVNHLFLVNQNGWSQTYPTNTDSDLDQLSGPGATVLKYVLFGDPGLF